MHGVSIVLATPSYSYINLFICASLYFFHVSWVNYVRSAGPSSCMESWAEDDVVIGAAGASVGAGVVVLGVAVGVRAQPLEEPGVVRRPAAVGRRAGAAVLVRLKHGARVVAAAGGPQRGGALRRDIGVAPWPALGAPGAAAGGQEVHGHVEAVHQGDVDEVQPLELVQPELGQRVHTREKFFWSPFNI